MLDKKNHIIKNSDTDAVMKPAEKIHKNTSLRGSPNGDRSNLLNARRLLRRPSLCSGLLATTVMVLTLLAGAGVFFAQDSAALTAAGVYDFVPQPELLYPHNEDIDLRGADYMDFKWSPFEGDIMQRCYYDFRLYESRDMVEKTLIYKERVDYNKYSLKISANLFKDGGVYTWSLRQVNYSSSKSLRSAQSFKIWKK